MENYFNIRKRQEGFNGSGRTVIGTSYNLAGKLGTGILGYSFGEVVDSMLEMLDHQAPRVIIKSEPDTVDKIMGYQRLGFIELLDLRNALRGKRPDIHFD